MKEIRVFFGTHPMKFLTEALRWTAWFTTSVDRLLKVLKKVRRLLYYLYSANTQPLISYWKIVSNIPLNDSRKMLKCSVNQHFTKYFNFEMQHLTPDKNHAKCTRVQSTWWQNLWLLNGVTVQYQQGHSNNTNITLNLGSVSHNNYLGSVSHNNYLGSVSHNIYLGSVSHKTCDSHS